MVFHNGVLLKEAKGNECAIKTFSNYDSADFNSS